MVFTTSLYHTAGGKRLLKRQDKVSKEKGKVDYYN